VVKIHRLAPESNDRGQFTDGAGKGSNRHLSRRSARCKKSSRPCENRAWAAIWPR